LLLTAEIYTRFFNFFFLLFSFSFFLFFVFIFWLTRSFSFVNLPLTVVSATMLSWGQRRGSARLNLSLSCKFSLSCCFNRGGGWGKGFLAFRKNQTARSSWVGLLVRCFSDHLHSTEVSDCAPPCQNPELGASTVKRETAPARWYSADCRAGLREVAGAGSSAPMVSELATLRGNKRRGLLSLYRLDFTQSALFLFNRLHLLELFPMDTTRGKWRRIWFDLIWFCCCLFFLLFSFFFVSLSSSCSDDWVFLRYFSFSVFGRNWIEYWV